MIAMHGSLLAMIFTAMAELFLPPLRVRLSSGERTIFLPGIAVGLLASTAVMAFVGPASYPSIEPGPMFGLLGILLGGVLVFCIAVPTDIGAKPRTMRHFAATMAGAIVLAASGFAVPRLGVPGLGDIGLTLIAGTILAVGWVFVVVSLLEICSLLPLLTGVIALLVGAIAFVPGWPLETVPGLATGGILAGAIVGRVFGEILRGRSRPATKSEGLLLGYYVAVATMTLFLKSLVLTAFVLPVAVVAIAVMILTMQAFDRSLVLRKSPRN